MAMAPVQTTKEIIETAGVHAGATLAVIALAKSLHGPFKTWRAKRKAKKLVVPTQLASIKECLDQIFDRLGDIEDTLDIHTKDLRLNVSATGAALDGLLQHDSAINGPVTRWKERLEDRIQEGVGEPRSPRKDQS